MHSDFLFWLQRKEKSQFSDRSDRSACPRRAAHHWLARLWLRHPMLSLLWKLWRQGGSFSSKCRSKLRQKRSIKPGSHQTVPEHFFEPWSLLVMRRAVSTVTRRKVVCSDFSSRSYSNQNLSSVVSRQDEVVRDVAPSARLVPLHSRRPHLLQRERLKHNRSDR